MLFKTDIDHIYHFVDIRFHDDQKKLISLRLSVNQLYFVDGLSKSAIATHVGVSRRFVIRWTQSMDQDVTIDHRGWPKGRRRRWSEQTEQRISLLHKELKSGPDAFYWGPTAIAQEWFTRYPDDPSPPLRTIGQILKDLGLSEPRSTRTRRGASRYLCYPEHTIYETLGRVMETDFIGRRHIKGTPQPIHFVGFSFKKAPRLRHYERIEAQTADCFIEQCESFFSRFEKADCVKMDNDPATAGSGSQKRSPSRVVRFLLANEVVPIFAVPRRPFSQASIEGNNSVFARKFWNRRTFGRIEEIDSALVAFNDASLKYAGYHPPAQTAPPKEPFVPRIYFIRQVREAKGTTEGFINVLNETILLPRAYINYFVLAEWNLNQEILTVSWERDQQLQAIINCQFPINPGSKKL